LKKSRTCFHENRKLCFFSKSRKKTSGTLYSVFKEPDPGFGRGRAVPPAQLPDNSRPKTEISEYEFFRAGSTKTGAWSRSRRDEQRVDRAWERTGNPFGWTRNIGVRGGGCQALSKFALNRPISEIYRDLRCTLSCAAPERPSSSSRTFAIASG
jgi:hypothetical protein